MSNKATNWAQTQRVGHTGAKFVLLVLADYADQEWSCFPSVKVIAQITEMGESTVRKALAVLLSGGFIRCYGRKRTDGSQRSSRYQLLPDGDETPEPEICDWSYQRSMPDPPLSDSEGGPLALTGPPLSNREAIPSKDPSLVDPSPLTPRASRAERATRLPEDFQPTDEMRAWFVDEKLGQVIDGRIEHEKFVNYWVGCPGAKGRKLDWPRTWKNWMWTAAERASRGGNTPVATIRNYPSTTDLRVSQGLSLAARFREQEEGK